MSGYDVIGDVHGQADKLRELLKTLGYRHEYDTYRHPTRQAIFVGDLIDRGPEIREVLVIVRRMVDSGSALAVMGNHELNAVLFHSTDGAGRPLRAHTPEKIRQHAATLEQLARPSPQEWKDWLNWFKGLPFSLDIGGLRVVHACWNAEALESVGGRSLHERDFLLAAGTSGTPEQTMLDLLLKGPELDLPPGLTWFDKDGHERATMRTKWFFKPDGLIAYSYRKLALPELECLPDVTAPESIVRQFAGYGTDEPPVLFGHYWLPPGPPERLAPNVGCLDYSAAKGGPLVAYRWDGERELQPKKFVAC